jgi:hypothetical protein
MRQMHGAGIAQLEISGNAKMPGIAIPRTATS